MEKQKPLHRIRIGAVQASIWQQVTKHETFLTVTFSKSFKDKGDQWKNGHSYTEHDLDAQMNCALEAKEWMRTYRQSHTRAA